MKFIWICFVLIGLVRIGNFGLKGFKIHFLSNSVDYLLREEVVRSVISIGNLDLLNENEEKREM